MKTLYIECNMGAAGDMLLSALLDLMPENDTKEYISKESFIEQLNNAGIPGVRYTLTRSQKCGIYGTKVVVTVNGSEEKSCDVVHSHMHEGYCHMNDENSHLHEESDHSHVGHSHSGLNDIIDIINSLKIPSMVKMDAVAVYNILAEAESVAHNCKVSDIHFHEVGTMDAIADIVGVCLAIYRIKADKIISGPVHVGAGQVRCAHGILPVPAPATAYILKDIPIYGGQIKGELCTPTGAALLKYYVEKFSGMPLMTLRKMGIGCGTKDFEQANIVRIMLGDLAAPEMKDNIYELSCNIDDMTGEEIAFATESLLEAGALDVYTINIGMKKNRPGVMINCICRPGEKEKFVKLIFKYTSTLGIREKRMDRYVLNREYKSINTEYGTIHVKHSFGYDSDIKKYEYDEISRLAKANNESLHKIRHTLEKYI